MIRARMGELSYHLTTEKWIKYFSILSIDTIVRLRPITLDGSEHMVVAIDAFIK